MLCLVVHRIGTLILVFFIVINCCVFLCILIICYLVNSGSRISQSYGGPDPDQTNSDVFPLCRSSLLPNDNFCLFVFVAGIVVVIVVVVVVVMQFFNACGIIVRVALGPVTC